MSLKYPAFDRNEYNFVSSDLTIVDVALRYKESVDKINALTVERNTKALRESTDVSHLVDEVVAMAKVLNLYEKNEVKRVDQLRMSVKRYQELKGAGYSTPILANEIRAIVGDVARHYFTFDIKKFRDDVSKCIEIDASVQEPLKKELQSLHGKIVAEKEKLKQILDSVATCCVSGVLPKAFKGRKRVTGKPTSEQVQLDRSFAEFILSCFVTDWKERASMFTIPVTVTGIAIGTMSGPKRDLWFGAFNKLGLNKVVNTRPVYMWIKDDGSVSKSGQISFKK